MEDLLMALSDTTTEWITLLSHVRRYMQMPAVALTDTPTDTLGRVVALLIETATRSPQHHTPLLVLAYRAAYHLANRPAYDPTALIRLLLRAVSSDDTAMCRSGLAVLYVRIHAVRNEWRTMLTGLLTMGDPWRARLLPVMAAMLCGHRCAYRSACLPEWLQGQPFASCQRSLMDDVADAPWSQIRYAQRGSRARSSE
jgi:hypothetical protein